MFPIREFESRFREILEKLDELDAGTEDDEWDELNATFEDALFVIESTDPEEEDCEEAFADALEEFDDLTVGYRKQIGKISGLEPYVVRLENVVSMAKMNFYPTKGT